MIYGLVIPKLARVFNVDGLEKYLSKYENDSATCVLWAMRRRVPEIPQIQIFQIDPPSVTAIYYKDNIGIHLSLIGEENKVNNFKTEVLEPLWYKNNKE